MIRLRTSGRIASILALVLLLGVRAWAQTAISVTSASDLVNAITTVDGSPGTSYAINFTGSITLGAGNTLPAINSSSSVTIDGHSATLDGGGVQRGFVVLAGTVTIQNLTIQNTVTRGGTGGSGAAGGGGGLGAGGALIAAGGSVTLSNVTLGSSGSPNSAIGGNGGAGGSSGGSGGGGGFGGNGGNNSGSGGGGGGGLVPSLT